MSGRSSSVALLYEAGMLSIPFTYLNEFCNAPRVVQCCCWTSWLLIYARDSLQDAFMDAIHAGKHGVAEFLKSMRHVALRTRASAAQESAHS